MSLIKSNKNGLYIVGFNGNIPLFGEKSEAMEFDELDAADICVELEENDSLSTVDATKLGIFKETQDIYAIEKSKLKEIIQEIASKGDYNHSSLVFGESNLDEILVIVDGVKESKPGIVSLARVAQKLRSLETGKMPGCANFVLNEIIREMKKVRVIEDKK